MSITYYHYINVYCIYNNNIADSVCTIPGGGVCVCIYICNSDKYYIGLQVIADCVLYFADIDRTL